MISHGVTQDVLTFGLCIASPNPLHRLPAPFGLTSFSGSLRSGFSKDKLAGRRWSLAFSFIPFVCSSGRPHIRGVSGKSLCQISDFLAALPINVFLQNYLSQLRDRSVNPTFLTGRAGPKSHAWRLSAPQRQLPPTIS